MESEKKLPTNKQANIEAIKGWKKANVHHEIQSLKGLFRLRLVSEKCWETIQGNKLCKHEVQEERKRVAEKIMHANWENLNSLLLLISDFAFPFLSYLVKCRRMCSFIPIEFISSQIQFNSYKQEKWEKNIKVSKRNEMNVENGNLYLQLWSIRLLKFHQVRE